MDVARDEVPKQSPGHSMLMSTVGCFGISCLAIFDFVAVAPRNDPQLSPPGRR